MRTRKIETTIQIYTLDELAEAERELVLAARKATSLSYSPYSHFRVGCAVRLTDGLIVPGANQENASYGLALCSERTTLFGIGNMGRKADVTALAVTGRLGTVPEATYRGKAPLTPCGACRQVIREFQDLGGRPIVLLLDGYCDEIWRVEGIDALLPLGFGPMDFGVDIHG